MKGHGRYTFTDGDVYEGEFDNDEYNGNGVLTYADGARYEGEFEDN